MVCICVCIYMFCFYDRVTPILRLLLCQVDPVNTCCPVDTFQAHHKEFIAPIRYIITTTDSTIIRLHFFQIKPNHNQRIFANKAMYTFNGYMLKLVSNTLIKNMPVANHSIITSFFIKLPYGGPAGLR